MMHVPRLFAVSAYTAQVHVAFARAQALDAVLDAAADGETVSEDFSEEMPEQSSSAELTSGAFASKPPGKRARCSGDGA